MIYFFISEALGNQMFKYASGKSYCLDREMEFRYYRPEKNLYGDDDLKYGRDLETIFNIPSYERVYSLPKSVEPLNLRKDQRQNNKVLTDYDIKDESYIKEFDWSPRTFYHRIDEIRNWFKFPEDINSDAETIINDVRDSYINKKIIAVHFRTGYGYSGAGAIIGYKYYTRAASYIQSLFGNENVIYLLFYDIESSYVNRFRKKHKCLNPEHSSLVMDMSLMSKCDGAIIANSTFSTWACLLGNMDCVCCPSRSPIWGKYLPDYVYADEWKRIRSRVSLKSFIHLKMKRAGGFLFRYLSKVKVLYFLAGFLPEKFKNKLSDFCNKNC